MNSNRSKQSLILVLVVALLAAGVYWTYLLQKQIKEDSIKRFAQARQKEIESTALDLKHFIDRYFNELSFFSDMEDVRAMNSYGKKILRVFYRHNRDYLKAITRVTKDGLIEYTEPYIESVIGNDISYQRHNWEVMHGHQPIISDVFQAVQNFRAIAFVYPVFDPNGNYDGSISMLLSFDNLTRKFLHPLEKHEYEHTFLLSSKGTILYSHRNSQIGQPIVLFTKTLPVGEKTINKILKNASHSLIRGNSGYEIIQKNGKEILVSYTVLPLFKTYWIILDTIPLANIYSEWGTYKKVFFAIFFALGVGFLFSFFLFQTYRSRKIKRELKELEDLTNILSKTSGIIVYRHNFITGNTQWRGAIEKITGYSQEEFQNFTIENWINILHPDDKSKYSNNFAEFKHERTPKISRYRIRRKNGTFTNVEEVQIVYENKETKTYFQMGAIKDISQFLEEKEKLEEKIKELEGRITPKIKDLEEENTQLKKTLERLKIKENELLTAQKELENADEMKRHFLNLIQHEIHTPLNGLLMNAQSIMDHLTGENPAISDAVEGIRQAVFRLRRTTKILLKISELTSGSLKINPQLFDMYEDLLDRIIQRFESNAKAHNVKIKIEKLSSANIVKQDFEALEEIFEQLIDNAIKYTENGTVTITIESIGNEEFLVTIADTGIGISEKNLKNIFDYFVQEDPGGYARPYEGVGLGLSLVKEYCKLCNIKLEVKSQKNIGSIFTLKIPSIK